MCILKRLERMHQDMESGCPWAMRQSWNFLSVFPFFSLLSMCDPHLRCCTLFSRAKVVEVDLCESEA